MSSLFKPKNVGFKKKQITAGAQPWDVIGTPLGGLTFDDEGKMVGYQLSPEIQNLLNQYSAALGGYQQQFGEVIPQLGALGQDYLSQYQAGMEALGPGREAQMGSIAEEYLARAQRQREAIAGYTPEAAAEDYYTKYVQPGLQMEQARQSLGAQNRLAQMGMLGSTGGAATLGQLGQAQLADIRAARGEAFGQAQQMQDLMRQREAQDLGQGYSMLQDIYNRAQGAAQTGTGLLGGTIDAYGNLMNAVGAGAQGMMGLYGAPLQLSELAFNPAQLLSGAQVNYRPQMQANPLGGLVTGVVSSFAGGYGQGMGSKPR